MEKYFTDNLTNDVVTVRNILPKTTYGNRFYVSEEKIEFKLSFQTVNIPYRIYLTEPTDAEIATLSDVQKQILYCLYTRSCDGHLREKYVKKLLKSNIQEWCIPFIVKLCDEYVIEILYVIYESLRERENSDIKEFCINNKSTICRSNSRMISYWNEYYRKNICNLDEYVGNKLFRECIGYNTELEKQIGDLYE